MKSLSMMRWFFCKGVMSVLLLLLGWVSSVFAEESILSFHSDIEVLRNGQLQITETIDVNSEGKQIRRGIYRDLPTSYAHHKYGHFGFKSKAPIQIISLERNNQNEAYHTQKLINGVRVYFGRQSHLLKNGTHRYLFRYVADRQVLLEEDIAQIYWNVTGNGWSFPIHKASAYVKLPDSSQVTSKEVWTGKQREGYSNARFSGDNHVRSTQALNPYEGLTMKMKFTSDSLVLNQASELRMLIDDNKSIFIGFLLLCLMLIFFILAWLFAGRDPRKGIIVAQYRPVEDLSAAAHRAALFNRADDTSFAVGVLSAAIKGWLTISKSGSKGFTLKSEGEGSELSPSEELLVSGLFKNRKSVTVGKKYNASIAALRKRYQKFLRKEFANKAHKSGAGSLIGGGLIGFAGVWLVLSPMIEFIIELFPFLMILGMSLVMLNKFISKFTYHSIAFSVAAYAGIVSLLFLYKGFTYAAIPTAIFAIIFAAFTYLLPAPKQKARKMLDQIEGFRLYLAKAEHESLKRLDLPEKTPQLYEELLPFAVALDLETQWSEQFSDVLAAAGVGPNTSHGGWYRGGDYSSMSSFAPAVASGLATSVVAASTPPSSSSSGGGGFSGGGGGGGGGGGW